MIKKINEYFLGEDYYDSDAILIWTFILAMGGFGLGLLIMKVVF